MRVLVLAAMVAGCAATPYEGGSLVEQLVSGTVGQGATASPLGGDLWRVRVSLNSQSTQSLLQDYTLLKAAETARANGAIGFVIIDEKDTSVVTSTYQPSYVPYSAGSISHDISPSGLTVIKLMRERTPDMFVADDIIATIGPRVRRK